MDGWKTTTKPHGDQPFFVYYYYQYLIKLHPKPILFNFYFNTCVSKYIVKIVFMLKVFFLHCFLFLSCPLRRLLNQKTFFLRNDEQIDKWYCNGVVPGGVVCVVRMCSASGSGGGDDVSGSGSCGITTAVGPPGTNESCA